MRNSVKILSLMVALAACGEANESFEDAVDPIDGEISALSVTSPEEVAILHVANTASLSQLDIEARLDKRAAQGIVDLRGPGFATLEQLDAVPYVGDVAVARLLEYAYARGLVDAGEPVAEPEAQPDEGALVHGIAEGSAEAYGILTAANTLDFATLDNTVGLDRRAAQNIVDGRGAGFASLADLDQVSYVGAKAFEQLLAFARAAGMVVAPPQYDAVIHDGAAQCSGSNGTRYTYTVISNPPEAVTDGRITLRFNSSSPYSPRTQALEIETAPDQWSAVFTTMPAVGTWQQQTVIVPAETLNAAREAMGWIRFRVNPGTAYTACSELDLTYNCPECFACPEGQEDVGFGCQEIGAPFNQTLLDHSRGMCARNSATVEFYSAPAAGSDGALSLEFLPCDGGRIAVSLYTQNAGWVDVGTASTGLSCGYHRANFQVPEAYLDAARDADGRIQLRYNITDSCRPGMGCASHDDPCVRRVNLQYAQE